MKISSKSWYYIVLSVFILAFLGMTIVGSDYNISWLVSNVQQIVLLPPEYSKALYAYKTSKFITYFIIDIVFFSTTLCILIYSTTAGLIKTRIKGSYSHQIKSFIPAISFRWIDSGDYKRYRRISIILSIALILAFVFDTIENLQYLLRDSHQPFRWIVSAKMICYATGFFILIFSWVYYLFSVRFIKQWQNLAKTLRYNWISLIIIVLTFVLLNAFAQGGALLFDLFDNKLQLIICLALITLLTFFIWQFPDELIKSRIASLKKLRAEDPDSPDFNEQKITRLTELKEVNRPIRRILALAFNLGLIYACCNVLHQNWLSYGGWVSAVLFSLVIAVLYYFLYKKVTKAYSFLKAPEPPVEAINFEKRSNLLWAFFCMEFSLAALIIIGMLLCLSGFTYCIKLALLIAFFFFIGCLFIALSPKRSDESIPFFHILPIWRLIKSRGTQSNEILPVINQNPGSIRAFLKENFWNVSLVLAGLNLAFLVIILLTGTIKWANPLNVLFSILCFYYSLVLVSIYYRHARMSILPIAVLLGFLSFYTSNIKDNNYHTLTPVRNDSIPALNAFLESRNIQPAVAAAGDSGAIIVPKDTSPIFIIAADGGGLRAAYWNLLVMNELNKQYSDFYNHVFAVTGVSGGSIGQGMYLYMQQKQFGKEKIKTISDSIGTANFLSDDLYGAFLSSVIMSFVPLDNMDRLKDRAEIMERNYLQLINNSRQGKADFFQTAYDDYWEQALPPPLFFPLSAQIEKGQRAFPAAVSGLKASGITTGAIDINALNGDSGRSLSFADAVFTSNRFPVFSPAAKIGNLGHFVDGGYFDNSSVFTAVEIIRFLKRVAPDRRIHVIRIRNSKDIYIHKHFAKPGYKTLEIKNASEQSVILSGAMNSGLRGMHVWGDDYLLADSNAISTHFIDLPFLLDKREVQDALGKHLLIDQNTLDDIIGKMDTLYHQTLIDCPNFKEKCTCLQEPPLGRILSKNVQEQMECLLKHEEVKVALDAIGRIGG